LAGLQVVQVVAVAERSILRELDQMLANQEQMV
jgi:hypothetical protein